MCVCVYGHHFPVIFRLLHFQCMHCVSVAVCAFNFDAHMRYASKWRWLNAQHLMNDRSATQRKRRSKHNKNKNRHTLSNTWTVDKYKTPKKTTTTKGLRIDRRTSKQTPLWKREYPYKLIKVCQKHIFSFHMFQPNF